MKPVRDPSFRFCALTLPFLMTAGLLGCDEETAAPPGPGQKAGIAVVSSDFKSTSVSLIDPATGAMARDACFHSGSTAPQVVTALSSDVSLPTGTQPGNELLLIDRGNASLTWLDPSTCAVKRQLSVSGGFDANPHDVAAVSPTRAFVTRYNPNPGNAAEGSDIAIIDPSVPAIIGSIDLRAHADEGVLARPDRAVVLRGLVYVTLNQQSADYKRAGSGKVLVIDPATNAVRTVVTLPFKNCGPLALVADDAVVIGCGGHGPMAIADSGAVWLNAGETVPTGAVAAGPFGRALSLQTIAALDRRRAFAVVSGEFKGAADALWTFDFAGGTPGKVVDASGPFTLGDLLVDARERRLYLADGDEKAPKLRSFAIPDSGPLVERAPTSSGGAGLPARVVAFF